MCTPAAGQGEAAGGLPARGALTRLPAAVPSQVQPPGEPLRVGISPVSLFLGRCGSSGFSARGTSRCQEAGKGTDLNPAAEFGASGSRRRGVAVSQGDGSLLLLLTPPARRVGHGRKSGCGQLPGPAERTWSWSVQGHGSESPPSPCGPTDHLTRYHSDGADMSPAARKPQVTCPRDTAT